MNIAWQLHKAIIMTKKKRSLKGLKMHFTQQHIMLHSPNNKTTAKIHPFLHAPSTRFEERANQVLSAHFRCALNVFKTKSKMKCSKKKYANFSVRFRLTIPGTENPVFLLRGLAFVCYYFQSAFTS